MAGTTSTPCAPDGGWDAVAPYPPDPAWVRSRTRLPAAYRSVAPCAAYAPELAAGGLWLFGPAGCGKTATLHGIRLWWDASHVETCGGSTWCLVRYPAAYVVEDEMVERLETAQRSFRLDFEAELARYAGAPLLCVDEAGEAEPTKACHRAWSRVLQAREASRLPTAVASRGDVGDFCEAFARSKTVSPRRAGRLGELVRRSMVPRRVAANAAGPCEDGRRRELGVVQG